MWGEGLQQKRGAQGQGKTAAHALKRPRTDEHRQAYRQP